MKLPLISVIMGVYYQRHDTTLLVRSVRSVLSQTYSDFELIICDDGSSDQAQEALDQLALQDSRVRLVRSGSLISLPQKLNACLKEARGSFIARMDDDDFSRPDRFEKQVKYMLQNPNAAFVGCNVALCRDGTQVGERKLPEFPEVRDFYFVQPYIHPALIFRRDVLVAEGGYSEDRHCILCEDYDLLLRLYAAGHRGINLQEILFDYTVSSTAKGNRKMYHRWNEAVTRWRRFRQLGVLPEALPFVIKPLIVGLIPEVLLRRLKEGHQA